MLNSSAPLLCLQTNKQTNRQTWHLLRGDFSTSKLSSVLELWDGQS